MSHSYLPDPLTHLIYVPSYSDALFLLGWLSIGGVLMSPTLAVLGLIYAFASSISGCPCVLCRFRIETSSWGLLPQSSGNGLWIYFDDIRGGNDTCLFQRWICLEHLFPWCRPKVALIRLLWEIEKCALIPGKFCWFCCILCFLIPILLNCYHSRSWFFPVAPWIYLAFSPIWGISSSIFC